METFDNKIVYPEISRKEMQKYTWYLNILHESGVTNMFGAAPYLVTEFGLSKPKAKRVLSRWMEEFK